MNLKPKMVVFLPSETHWVRGNRLYLKLLVKINKGERLVDEANKIHKPQGALRSTAIERKLSEKMSQNQWQGEDPKAHIFLFPV